MNRPTWTKIGAALRASGAPRPPRPAAEFWADFRARARLHPQWEPAPARPSPIYRWAWAGAFATVLAVAGSFGVVRWIGSRSPSEVHSVEIFAPHGGVVIMADAPTRSTVLWIVNMEEDSDNGGST
jgi:hypothetical protein